MNEHEKQHLMMNWLGDRPVERLDESGVNWAEAKRTRLPDQSRGHALYKARRRRKKR